MRLRGDEGEDSRTKYLEKIEDARLRDGHGCWVGKGRSRASQASSIVSPIKFQKGIACVPVRGSTVLKFSIVNVMIVYDRSNSEMTHDPIALLRYIKPQILH